MSHSAACRSIESPGTRPATSAARGAAVLGSQYNRSTSTSSNRTRGEQADRALREPRHDSGRADDDTGRGMGLRRFEVCRLPTWAGANERDPGDRGERATETFTGGTSRQSIPHHSPRRADNDATPRPMASPLPSRGRLRAPEAVTPRAEHGSSSPTGRLRTRRLRACGLSRKLGEGTTG